MSRRGLAAVAILALWVAGLGFLVRRELFRPHTERFAEMGLRVTPGATYYGVMREGRHIGFASSTIDTTTTDIRIVDYLVADLPIDGREHRTSARTRVRLSRGMRLRDFHLQLDAEQGPIIATGEVEGDSVMVVVLQAGEGAPADTQRVRLDGPVVMPNMIPLAVALQERPEVGASRAMPVFDPIARAPKSVPVSIEAESLFVVHDSSTYDAASDRWVALLPDTVRAWRISDGDARMVDGWVDAQGRLVRGTQLGLVTLERMPYELAFENWQRAKENRSSAAVSADEDILESTAIASNVRVDRSMDRLRVVLRGVDFVGFDLAADRQTLAGDTLTVVREGEAQLTPAFRLGSLTRDRSRDERRAMQEYLKQEPLVETMDPDVRGLAMRLRAGDRDPRVVAERINRWVHDSLAKRTTFGIPSARAVLEARAGDCNEHTQLYVALARSAGLPARVAAGLVYVNGRFYYHAWPEIYLGAWVAVDPTLGQFPADAAHLRFTVGGLARQAELVRLIGNLEIDVLDAR